MKSPTGKRLINEVAEETGLSRNVVYKIVMSQYGCVRDTIKASVPDKPETFESVRLPYWGIFKARLHIFSQMKGIEGYNKERKRRREERYGKTNDK